MNCVICGEECSTEHVLHEHMVMKHSGEGFSCPFCHVTSTNIDELNSHVNKDHITTPVKQSRNQQPVVFYCPICDCECGDLAALSVHAAKCGMADNSESSHSIEDSNNASTGHSCPLCHATHNNIKDLETHVQTHFNSTYGDADAVDNGHLEAPGTSNDHALAQMLERQEKLRSKEKEQREFEKLQAEYGVADGDTSNYMNQSSSKLQTAVNRGRLSPLEYHIQRQNAQVEHHSGVDMGGTVTKDILRRIREFASDRKNTACGSTWLCSTPVDHHSSNAGDQGWGCGYRNAQMMLSSLLHHPRYKQLLFNGRRDMPSIEKLQELIECGWSKGYDRLGRDQLGGKLVGTRKWIGATEILVLLLQYRVRAEVHDFHTPDSGDGTHPRMFDWILRHFMGTQTGAARGRDDPAYVSPLYIQHQGHSRTVVGIERGRNNVLRLLVFDPSAKRDAMRGLADVGKALNNNTLALIRRTKHAFKSDKYQIIRVRDPPLNDDEVEASKTFTSVVTKVT